MKNLVGAEIRRRRKALKITLEELAHRVSSDSGNLSRAERGVQGVSDDLLRALAKELGCTVADFYVGESTEASTPIGAKRIPLYTQQDFELLDDGVLPDAVNHLLTDLDISSSSYAVDINDDAIANEFKNGDRLIVDTQLSAMPGDVVAVRSHRLKKTFIRKYKAIGFNPEDGGLVFEAKPTDLDYPSMHSTNDLLQVLGVVVEHRKNLKRR